MNTAQCKGRRAGFTLIELLVVVAIIALLLSILLPSLSHARELTRESICMSNLKSQGTAMDLYAQDYDYRRPLARCQPWDFTVLPSSQWNVGDNRRKLTDWYYTTRSYTGVTVGVGSPPEVEHEWSLYRCPSSKVDPKVYEYNVEWLPAVSYWPNLLAMPAIWGNAGDPIPASTTSYILERWTEANELRKPSDTMLLVDGNVLPLAHEDSSEWVGKAGRIEGSSTWDVNWRTSEWIWGDKDSGEDAVFEYFHNGRKSVLFVDYHVERVTPEMGHEQHYTNPTYDEWIDVDD